MDERKNIKKLLRLLLTYKKKIAIIILSVLMSTGLNCYIPIINKRIMDEGFIGKDFNILIKLSLLMLLFNVLMTLIDLYKENLRIDIQGNIEIELKKEVFRHITKIKMEYLGNLNNTELCMNINTDAASMANIADENMLFVISKVFTILGGIIGLFYISWHLTLIVLIFIPFKYIIITFFSKFRNKLMSKYIESIQSYARWFSVTIAGMKEIRVFNVYQQKEKEFEQKIDESIKYNKLMNFVNEENQAADSLLVTILSTILYIVGAKMIFNYQLSIGSIFAFITYSSYVTNPISAIISIKYYLSGILPSAKRYYDFMDLAEEDYTKGGQYLLFGKDILFQNVTFFYNREFPLFENINLSFSRGEKIAIIGKNGVGKTSIIEILLRFYDKKSGNIKMDGIDIEMIPLMDYRMLFSIVSQEIYLFNDSIFNNICLYQDMNSNSVFQAIEDSGLKAFVDTHSMDYMVGENGSRLSGGQKQKVALARALLSDSPIIVFDEATSNMDTHSENQINNLLTTRLSEKIVIIISHRTDILDVVDKIYLLKDGGVVQTK